MLWRSGQRKITYKQTQVLVINYSFGMWHVVLQFVFQSSTILSEQIGFSIDAWVKMQRDLDACENYSYYVYQCCSIFKHHAVYGLAQHRNMMHPAETLPPSDLPADPAPSVPIVPTAKASSKAKAAPKLKAFATRRITEETSPNTKAEIMKERLERKRETSRKWHKENPKAASFLKAISNLFTYQPKFLEMGSEEA